MVLVVVAISATGQTMIRPVATYRAIEFGSGVVGVSVLVAASSFLAVVAALPLGRWADRAGPRHVMTAGTGLLGLGSFGAAVSTSLPVLASSMAVVGVAHVAVLLGAQAVAAETTSLSDRQRRFARNAAAGSLGQIAGPLLGGLLITSATGPFRFITTPALIVGSSLGVVALGCTLAIPARASAVRTSQPGATRAELVRLLRLPGMATAVVSGVSLLVAVDVVLAYMPLIGDRAGVSPSVVGLLLSLRGVSSLVARVFAHAAVSRLGTRRFFMVAFACAAVALTALAWSSSATHMGALLVLFGLSVGAVGPLTAAWVAQLAPPSLRATALGLRLTGNRLAQALIPLGLGALGAAAGVSAVLLTPAVGLALCIVAIRRAELGEHRAE